MEMSVTGRLIICGAGVAVRFPPADSATVDGASGAGRARRPRANPLLANGFHPPAAGGGAYVAALFRVKLILKLQPGAKLSLRIATPLLKSRFTFC